MAGVGRVSGESRLSAGRLTRVTRTEKPLPPRDARGDWELHVAKSKMPGSHPGGVQWEVPLGFTPVGWCHPILQMSKLSLG